MNYTDSGFRNCGPHWDGKRGDGSSCPFKHFIPGAAAHVWTWASLDSSSAEEKTSTEDHLPRPHVQDCTVMHPAERLPAHFWGNLRERSQLGKNSECQLNWAVPLFWPHVIWKVSLSLWLFLSGRLAWNPRGSSHPFLWAGAYYVFIFHCVRGKCDFEEEKDCSLFKRSSLSGDCLFLGDNKWGTSYAE